MPKYVYDGIIQLWVVDDIDDPTSPALDEVEGGVNLTPFLRAVDTPLEGSTADAHTAETKFNATVSATYGGQPVSATFTRDKVYADDDAWTKLQFGYTGFWVIAWRGGTGVDNALEVGDRVDVWDIDVLSRNPVPYGKDVLAALTVQCATPTPPNQDVVLLAS